MSAGEFFELIRPVTFLVSALLSIWVLASARKRFPLYLAIIWAVGTLFLPLIVLPVYLCVILLWRPRVHTPRRRLVLPLAYGVIAVAAILVYFYRDNQSVDAHLARATKAKLNANTAAVISEYRQALALEDNPHTHKLLANELAEARYWTDAISEFRLAEEGGEPDDLIHYRLGLLLERIDQPGQAKLEFQNFLITNTCTQPNEYCDDARERIRRANE